MVILRLCCALGREDAVSRQLPVFADVEKTVNVANLDCTLESARPSLVFRQKHNYRPRSQMDCVSTVSPYLASRSRRRRRRKIMDVAPRTPSPTCAGIEKQAMSRLLTVQTAQVIAQLQQVDTEIDDAQRL